MTTMMSTMTGIFALTVCLFIGYLTLTVLLGVWIYKDAKKRGVDPLVWILAFVFSQGIGLILYLLVGRKQVITACPNCGKSVPDDAIYCMGCGSPITRTATTSSTAAASKSSNRTTSKTIMITIIALMGVSMVISMGTTIYTVSKTFSPSGIAKSTIFTGMYMTKSSSTSDNSWSITADALLDGRGVHSLDFSKGVPTQMSIDATVDKGNLILHLSQNNVTQDIEIKANEGPIAYELSPAFTADTIQVELEHQGVKNFTFHAEW